MGDSATNVIPLENDVLKDGDMAKSTLPTLVEPLISGDPLSGMEISNVDMASSLAIIYLIENVAVDKLLDVDDLSSGLTLGGMS